MILSFGAVNIRYLVFKEERANCLLSFFFFFFFFFKLICCFCSEKAHHPRGALDRMCYFIVPLLWIFIFFLPNVL